MAWPIKLECFILEIFILASLISANYAELYPMGYLRGYQDTQHNIIQHNNLKNITR